MTNRNTLSWLAMTCIAFVVAGCGDDREPQALDTDSENAISVMNTPTAKSDGDTAKKDSAPAKQLPLTEPRPNLVVTTGKSQFGAVLFDGDGQVFYRFESDTSATSTCYDDCAVAWPPVLVEGKPTAGTGANANKLSTTRRKDGTTQLTYGGRPMYYYAHEKPREVKCHNIETHGGLWWVVRADGSPAPA